MATKKLDEIRRQMARTAKKLSQLDARYELQLAKETKAAAKKTRNDETRRKILLGAYLLATYDEEELAALMEDYLIRDEDRSLFGLESLKNSLPELKAWVVFEPFPIDLACGWWQGMIEKNESRWLLP